MTTRNRAATGAAVAALVTPLLLAACQDADPTGPVQSATPTFSANPNPGVLPRNARPFGKTYEEWAMAYRQWWAAIPAVRNPSLDETGEFCGEGQSGPVWYLASRVGPGPRFLRECHVPAGRTLYVPVIGIIAWAPEDLGIAAFVAETFLGRDPATMTDEELLRSFANFFIDSWTDLTLIVDGVAYDELFSYRAASPAFDLIDTTFLDDIGNPISHPNLSVADGYALILSPLPRGEHTIEIRAAGSNPLFGALVNEITYHLTVGP